MSRGRRTAIVVGAVLVVLAVAGGAFLLLSGGDGPEPLALDDAPSTSTTAAAPGAPSTTVATGVATVDGRWVIGDGSQAGYRVLEDRLGGVQNIEAVGRTDQVTGGFTVAGTAVSDVQVTVDVASITSDSGLRDGRFRDSIMQSSQFPTATFTAEQVDLGSVPADGATVEVPVEGRLTLRGQTRDVRADLQVRREGDQVQVLGSVPVTFADYGIETPSPPGLSVRDDGTVEFLVVARRQP